MEGTNSNLNPENKNKITAYINIKEPRDIFVYNTLTDLKDNYTKHYL